MKKRIKIRIQWEVPFNELAIYLLMEKLAEITIDNSLTLSLNAQVDQSLLANNFTTIVQALKELQNALSLSDKKIADLNSLKDSLSQLESRLKKVEKDSENNSKESTANVANIANVANVTQNGELAKVESALASLQKRVEKNESNIIDNIKDINVLNSELRDAKSDIEQLKKKLSLLGSLSDKDSSKESSSYNVNDIAANINNELKKNEQNLQNIIKRLDNNDNKINELNDELRRIIQNINNSNSNENNINNNNSENQGIDAKDLDNLKIDLQDKIDVLNKKVNMLQNDINQHENDINYLKELIQNQEEHNQEEIKEIKDSSKEGTINQSVSSDLLKLRKKIEDVDNREKKDVKNLQDQINSLKQQLKSQQKSQKIQSKTSLEGDNIGSHRKLTISRDDLGDKVNDLLIRVSTLEKALAGSKNFLSDEKNPEKLPSIHRITKRRVDPNMTGFDNRQKDKSGISRKDISELKAELEAWLKSLLDGYQNRENFEAIELKIQELRKNVDRKADGEGTKKGFSFLQNKITQLYLFLTEPDAEDAMIVRKGFQCLSCSKKVQKLRGKLGPRINWNNMTSTNYSPPKVGYSKPMGGMDREDDL